MKRPREPQSLPPEIRAAFERFLHLRQAELHELDSAFFVQFADAQWPEALVMLERYCLKRFDVSAEYLRPLMASDRPEAMSIIERNLKEMKKSSLDFVNRILASASPEIRVEAS